jgi:hypothetical protein
MGWPIPTRFLSACLAGGPRSQSRYLQVPLHAAMAMAPPTGVGVLTERPTSIGALGGGSWRLWATLLWIRHTVTGFGYVASPGRGLRVGRGCRADARDDDDGGDQRWTDEHVSTNAVQC